jgi:hypothetical protein
MFTGMFEIFGKPLDGTNGVFSKLLKWGDKDILNIGKLEALNGQEYYQDGTILFNVM